MGLFNKLFHKDDIDVDESDGEFKFATSGEDEDAEKQNNRRTFLNKYKLGSHHKIERFGVMMGAVLAILVFASGFSLVRDTQKQKVTAVAKAKYTEDFTYSLTGNAGTVETVVRSDDGKTAYLLLKMENVGNMSTDASTYSVYLTGANDTLRFEPAGAYFVFGSTGYMGVMLHDDEGIPNQVLDVTIRANVDVRSDKLSSSTISDDQDESFKKYDQARIYVNFGAADADTNKVLDDTSIAASDLYYQLIAKELDATLREQLVSTKEDLDRLTVRADEYMKRITSVGYEAPDEPAWLDDNYVVAGGVLLSESKTLGDGYINQLISDYSQFSDYMKMKSKEVATESERLSVQIETLTASNGSVLELNEVSDGVSSPADLAVKADVVTLTTTWSSILSTKQKVQTDINRQLLMLDADMQDQNRSFSLGDTDQLILW